MVEHAKAFLIVKLVDWVESWLLNLRQEYGSAARPLNAEEHSEFRCYLTPDFLAAVRVVEVERIPNPKFFGSLSQYGLPVPWDFSSEPSLAAVDTIFLAKALVPAGRSLSILFHECIHVQQFQLLGMTKLVSRYVNGLFENGFNYSALPMERQAHDLQLRFDMGFKTFSVEREVQQALVGRAL